MDRALLAAFADLFAYPRGDVAASARHCLALFDHPALRAFAAWAARARPGEIEELYSATFDLSPVCAPYVGHQLWSEAFRRNLFLAGLAEAYAREGFQPRSELADHISELLYFLSVARDEEACAVLLRDAVAPAVKKMASCLAGNPWRALFEALDAYLASRGQVSPPEEVRP